MAAIGFALCAATATAQSVLPADANSYRYTGWDQEVFASNAFQNTTASRTQWIYDAADLGQATTARSLQLRLPTLAPRRNQPLACDLVLEISVSPAAPDQAVPSFDGNHGANRTQVFSGSIQLPGGIEENWPAPWLPAILFSAPIVLDPAAGASVVIDVQQRRNFVNVDYLVEAQYSANGAFNLLSTACPFASGGQPSGAGSAPGWPAPGQVFRPNFIGYQYHPNVHSAVVAIGTLGPGDPYLGRSLPIPLTELGIPVLNAGCALATDPAFIAPLRLDAFGRLEIRLQLPNVPTLGGTPLRLQPFILDQGSGTALGVHAGLTIDYRIGTARGRGTTVQAVGNARAANGRVSLDRIGTLRLNP